jgi:hypothetical protein
MRPVSLTSTISKIRNVHKYFKDLIIQLLNQSLDEGTILDNWKQAKIIIISKPIWLINNL